MYLESISVIENQHLLSLLAIQDYPHLKDQKRRQIFKELKTKAYPKFYNESAKESSLGDFAKILAGRPNG